MDYNTKGFRWIDCNNSENCIYAIERKSKNETLIAVFNFSSVEKKYSIKEQSTAKVLINTDWEKFGGNSKCRYEMDLNNMILPGFSGIMFRGYDE